MDPTAAYHRTLDGWLRDFPHNFENLPADKAAVFRKAGAREAYIMRDKKLAPIMYLPKNDKDFRAYATDWEVFHSKIHKGDGAGLVTPVVDENMMVIGHYGSFNSLEIFVPKNAYYLEKTMTVTSGPGPLSRGPRVVATRTHVTDKLSDYLDAGVEVIADYYHKQYHFNRGYENFRLAQQQFLVVTDIEGKVLLVLSQRDKQTLISVPYTPLDLISIVRAVVLVVAGAASAILLRTLARRRAAATLAKAGKSELTGEVAPQIPKQTKRVTQQDMLEWEKEGGHIIRHHGPQLTREKLKERVLGKEKNIRAPERDKDGYLPPDMRVWRGDNALAASAWESDETMRRAIGDIINKNLEQIRRSTQNGGSLALQNQSVGYRTGSGWVTTSKKSDAAMFYRDDLDGVTVIIRARRPTKSNPEEWYVHTAFPDAAR